MALSGTSSVAVGSYWRVQLEWTATQSTANNTSTVTAKLYWVGIGVHSTVYSTATKRFSITINGNTKNGTVPSAGLTAGQKRLVGTHTVTVPHNSEGAKSFTVSGTFGMEVTLSGIFYASRTTSRTYTLNTIARASTFTVSDRYLFSNQSSTITISRAHPSYSHNIKFEFGKATWSKKGVLLSTNFRPNDYGNDTQWSTIIGQNSAYIEGKITVTTYNGSTYIGATSVYAQVHVSQAFAPTAGTMTITDTNNKVATLMGSTTSRRALQTQSKLKFTVSGHKAGTGSVIDYVRISCDGTTSVSTNWTYGAPNKAQTYTVNWTVYDKRGRSAKGSATFVSLPYSLPKITASTVTRDKLIPTNVSVKFSGTVSSIKNASGTEMNRHFMKIDHKDARSTAYTSLTSTPVATGTTLSLRTYNQTNVSASKAFTYRLELNDVLGNVATAIVNLTSETAPLHISSVGIGVGKRHEQGTLDVRGDAYVSGKLTAGNIVKGYVSITPSAANTPTGVAVKWSMSGTPFIALGTHTALPGSLVIGTGFSGHSKTGATIYLNRANLTATNVHYICIV